MNGCKIETHESDWLYTDEMEVIKLNDKTKFK